MLYGYVAAAIAGFLLTAIPNWTGRLPVSGWSLAALAALWLAGRLAILFSADIGGIAAAATDASFLAALAAVAAREIVAGKNWRNLRVFATFHPNKIVELFAIGAGSGQSPGRSVQEIVEGFFSFPNFTRLATSTVVRKSVARGIKEKFFGYVAGAAPALGTDGRYQVAEKNVRFGSDIAEDEIDLDGGFVMTPETIPQPTSAAVPTVPESVTPGDAPVVGEAPTAPALPAGSPAPSRPQAVQFSFAADRNKLYAAWQAVANLADLCGNVSVSVKGEPPTGVDKSKLENGVYEPLREANLID
jgi:hypothetical protein